jgi:ABC transporter DrrB family efflux protein
MRAVAAVFLREASDLARGRARALAILAMPAIWLALLGDALGGALGRIPALARSLGGAPDYLSYFAPSVLVLGALAASARRGLSLVEDRELGLYERLRAAPIPRLAPLAGKLLAAAADCAARGLSLTAAAALLGLRCATGPLGVAASIAAATALGLGASALLLSLAKRSRTGASYAAAAGLLGTPLLLASTALLPAALLPPWLAVVAERNPLSLALASIRTIAFVGWSGPALLPGLAAIAIFAIAAFGLAAADFASRGEGD